MNAGDTYRREGSSHVYVVVSDPALDGENVVVVNFTSNKAWQDQSCLLMLGEHPFITEETVLFYAKARIHCNRELDTALASGRLTLHDPVSDAVLAKIRAGARDSDRLPFKMKQILEEQGLI